MKKKIFNFCVYGSTVLFFAFIILDAYVRIADPNPKGINDSGLWDWRSISIGHGKVSIAHSLKPTATKINLPDDIYENGGNFHFTVAKHPAGDMDGCYAVFYNQNIPFEGVRIFGFSDGDKRIDENGFVDYGMEFGSGTHSAKMLGCSDNDRTSEAVFIGYGILFFDLSHSVDKDKNWCTFMISLWYPIILFGIFPAIFVVKKLRNRKSTSTKDTVIEK